MTDMKYCPNCENECEFRFERRTEKYEVRGKEIPVDVDVEVCLSCEETLFDETRDESALKKVYAVFRQQKALLSPWPFES